MREIVIAILLLLMYLNTSSSQLCQFGKDISERYGDDFKILDFNFPNEIMEKILQARQAGDGCESRLEASIVYHQIYNAFKQGKSLLIGKSGGLEFGAMVEYDKSKKIKPSESLLYSAGIFPLKETILTQWAQMYKNAIQQFDVIIRWNDHMKKSSADNNIFAQIPFQLKRLESHWPWYWNIPYSTLFKDKTVLVVSPFHEDIIKQYEKNRACIYPSTNSNRSENIFEVLPIFKKLITINVPLPYWNVSFREAQNPSVDTFAGNTWFTNYEKLVNKIKEIKYDVVVIGAGAYGAPLGAIAKAEGKVAIVLGGNLGPLFGIKGHRFDERFEYKSYFYNDCWLRTIRPPGAEKIENGAYWRHIVL